MSSYNTAMKFCLVANPSDQWQVSIDHVLSLAESMTSGGHEVNAVLFFGQAIKVIQSPAHLSRWQHWQRNTQTPLMLCSTLLENDQLSVAAKQIECFEVVSLGSWVQAVDAADKTVELS